jgi:hypothetical protein
MARFLGRMFVGLIRTSANTFGEIPARLLRGQIHPGHAFILANGMLATILVARSSVLIWTAF